MRRTIVVLVVFAILASLAVMPVAASPSYGKAGNSSVIKVDLATTNRTVDPDAWGQLTFNTKNGKFVFNGHNLTPGVEYELRSAGPFTPPLTGVANRGGNVHIAGTVEAFPGNMIVLWNLEANVRVARGTQQ